MSGQPLRRMLVYVPLILGWTMLQLWMERRLPRSV